MIQITQKEIDFGLEMYQYYLMGRAGSFNNCLFDAISRADNGNLVRLAKSYPEFVYAHLEFTQSLYRVSFLVEQPK